MLVTAVFVVRGVAQVVRSRHRDRLLYRLLPFHLRAVRRVRDAVGGGRRVSGWDADPSVVEPGFDPLPRQLVTGGARRLGKAIVERSSPTVGRSLSTMAVPRRSGCDGRGHSGWRRVRRCCWSGPRAEAEVAEIVPAAVEALDLSAFWLTTHPFSSAIPLPTGPGRVGICIWRPTSGRRSAVKGLRPSRAGIQPRIDRQHHRSKGLEPNSRFYVLHVE